MQHQLSALIESIAFKRRIAAADEFASKRGSGRPHPRYDSTRLHALTAKNVSLWLYGSCFTTAPRLWLSGKLFCTAIRIRLGIAVGHDDHTCAICNKIGVSDGFGMHSLSCLSGGGKTLIHTRVLDEFQQLASSVAAVPSRENHALPLDPNLRLDLALTLPQTRGKPQLIDVAITNGLAKYFLDAKIVGPNRAATHYESYKRRKYDLLIAAQRPDATLVPVIFDTFGAVGDTGLTLLTSLLTLRARATGLPLVTVARLYNHRINFAVVEWSAKIAGMNGFTADPS